MSDINVVQCLKSVDPELKRYYTVVTNISLNHFDVRIRVQVKVTCFFFISIYTYSTYILYIYILYTYLYIYTYYISCLPCGAWLGFLHTSLIDDVSRDDRNTYGTSHHRCLHIYNHLSRE